MRNLADLKKGFTLIELVIVIGILAILVAVVISVLNPARFLAKSRDTRRQSDLKMVQAALEAYYSQNNAYPGSITFGAAWAGYLAMVPQDPSTDRAYCYEQTESGQDYVLCAHSELGITSGVTTRGTTCTVDAYPLATGYCLASPF
ncbi:MAG: prepilin-type N-terminal cleavage/methylation domain-containing protein [bacterium]|nr:prepilin-type N-terminal cleavage/methylation domain-containing protein [bacterium]